MNITQHVELRALCAAATPPPWEAGEEDRYNGGIPVSAPDGEVVGPGWEGGGVCGEADAAFISACRAALPGLLAEIAILRKGLERITSYAMATDEDYASLGRNTLLSHSALIAGATLARADAAGIDTTSEGGHEGRRVETLHEIHDSRPSEPS